MMETFIFLTPLNAALTYFASLPVRPCPFWLMPALSLLFAAVLVFAASFTIPLPFPAVWGRLASILILAFIGLSFAVFTRLLEHASAEGR
jgi:hypothetical protein